MFIIDVNGTCTITLIRRTAPSRLIKLYERKELIMKTKSWIIGILGLWVLFSAYFYASHVFFVWSNLVAGILVAGFGFAMISKKPSLGWTAGILGLWLVLAAFIPALHTGAALIWNGTIAGLIVALDGFYALSSSSRHAV